MIGESKVNESINEILPYRMLLNVNSNMMSFIGYINNTMIKLQIYFNSHMRIDEQIISIIPK